jgi:hypothetical protein
VGGATVRAKGGPEKADRGGRQGQFVGVVQKFAGEGLRWYKEHRLVGPASDRAGPPEEMVAAEPDRHL